MKKKVIIGGLLVFTLVLIGFLTYFFVSLTPVNKNNKKEVVFTIKSGTSKFDIAKELKNKKLIRSDKMAIIYMFFNNNSLQAGTYSLNETMGTRAILDKFSKGDIRVETINLQLIPGERITDYAKVISKTFSYSEEEIMSTINDKVFLKEMVEKYWFLTDSILNDKIYYGLEGYILPDTYEFTTNSSIKDIIIRLLDHTDIKLTPYKEKIENSKYDIHEILTIASIIDKEANSYKDRQSVAQVIFKRLDINMSLGMDVTTYYGAKKKMGDVLTRDDLVSGNAYNTRNTNMLGLPVGPICNPSKESIDAVFDPSNTDYVYFYADINTGDVYFANTYSEFLQVIQKINNKEVG